MTLKKHGNSTSVNIAYRAHTLKNVYFPKTVLQIESILLQKSSLWRNLHILNLKKLVPSSKIQELSITTPKKSRIIWCYFLFEFLSVQFILAYILQLSLQSVV